MTFAVLDPHTPIDKRCFLEASAGTGKTFTIEHVFLRLLLEKKELTLENILMVTFTKKATRDLRFRIFSSLQKAAQSLKQEEKSPYPYLNIYLSEPQKKKKALEKLQQALEQFDSACIFTIHSFCQKTLLDFAFEARQGVCFDASTSVDLLSVFQNMFVRLEEEKLHFLEFSALFKSFSSWEKLFSSVIRKLEDGLSEAPSDSLFQIFQKTQEILCHFPKQGLSSLKEDFALLFSLHKKTSFKNHCLDQEIKYLQKIGEEKKLSWEDFLQWIQLSPCLFPFLNPENRYKKKAFFSFSSLASAPIFSWAQKQLYPLLSQALLPSRILMQVAKLFEPIWLEHLQKGQAFSPGRILSQMKEALKHPLFTKQVKQQYQAVIIDEFQDTDPLQWEIFSHLFSHCSTFYLVGDPKQSIYGFRKADIYTYLAAKEQFQEVYVLDTNYRSTPELVHALNTLCFHRFSHPWIALPQKNTFLPYYPIKAGTTLKSLEDGKAPIDFLVVDKEAYPSLSPSRIDTEFFFPFIYEEIQSSSLPFSSFALLVKDRFQAQAAQSYLEQRGIATSTAHGPFLGNCLAFLALEELLSACLFFPNPSLTKLVLLGPLAGWRLEDLSQYPDTLPPWVDQAFSFLKKKLQEGMPSFFSSLWEVCLSLENKSIRQMSLQRGRPFYEELLQAMEMLLEKAKQNCCFPGEYVTLFSKIRKEELEKGKGRRLSLLSPSVTIMTIHASKGLEFEVVFALGVASKLSRKDPFLDSPDKEKELDAEKLRQFYVAITRAQKRVYLPLVLQEEIEPQPGKVSCIELFFSYALHKSPYQKIFKKEILAHLQQEVCFSFSFLQPQFIAPSSPSPARDLIAPPLLSYKKQGNCLFSFSSLSSYQERKEPITPSSDLPRGPSFGHFIHQILRNYFSSFPAKDFLVSFFEKELQSSEYEAYTQPICEMLFQTLCFPLFSSFSLSDLKKEQVWTEMEFLYPLKSSTQWMKGFIDLLFFYEGKYYLLDWKTNDLGEDPAAYLPKNLEKEMKKENYFLQASIYTTALQRYFSQIGKPFASCFGGMFYLFLRGIPKQAGIYFWIPETTNFGQENLYGMQSFSFLAPSSKLFG